MMNDELVAQSECLFWDIPHTTTNIEKNVAKNTESDISRVSGEPFSMGSTMVVVAMRVNVSMVHADWDNIIV